MRPNRDADRNTCPLARLPGRGQASLWERIPVLDSGPTAGSQPEIQKEVRMSLPNVTSPHPRCSIPRLSPIWPLLALCCCLTAAGAQPVPDTILLPDSLGPLCERYHLAVGGSNGDIYVASESTDIIVVDGTTYERVKRISTGTPVGGVCLVARHDKLYCSFPAQGRVGIVDCASNAIVGSVRVGAGSKTLSYNFLRDKLYCADTAAGTVSVIDCASDSVVATVAVGDYPGVLACDETTDKMYVATPAALVAVNCAADTVVATIGSVPFARALCLSRRNQKLYVVRGVPVLTILATPNDSVLAELRLAGFPSRRIACNDATNRVYVVDSTVGRPSIWMVDGSGDTIIKRGDLRYEFPGDMVCDTVGNRLYCSSTRAYRPCPIDIVDGSTLRTVASLQAGCIADAMLLDTTRGRVLCASRRGKGSLGDASSFLVVDCLGESLAAVVPLEHTPLSLDCGKGVAERLYYTWGYYLGGVGVIDERTGKVVAQIGLRQRVTTSLAYSSTSRKLYCGVGNGTVVIDGSGDSLLKSIEHGGNLSGLRWHSVLNKLYLVDDGLPPLPVLMALACDTDSIVATVRLRANPEFLVLAERQKVLYCIQDEGGFQVVGCDADTILVDSLMDWSVQKYAYAPVENKLFFTNNANLHIYHVWPSYYVASYLWPYGSEDFLACSDTTRKLYWKRQYAVSPSLGYDSIRVIDTRTDSVVTTLCDTFRLFRWCLDHTGRFLWAVPRNANAIVIYDTRADTIAAVLCTPPQPWTILPNPALERVYAGLSYSAILVYPDSVPSGLAAEPSSRSRALPSTVQTSANVHLSNDGPWYDVVGRRVATPTREDGRSEVGLGVYICPRPGRGTSKTVVVR